MRNSISLKYILSLGQNKIFHKLKITNMYFCIFYFIKKYWNPYTSYNSLVNRFLKNFYCGKVQTYTKKR